MSFLYRPLISGDCCLSDPICIMHGILHKYTVAVLHENRYKREQSFTLMEIYDKPFKCYLKSI